jgi:hypothetical protein
MLHGKICQVATVKVDGISNRKDIRVSLNLQHSGCVGVSLHVLSACLSATAMFHNLTPSGTLGYQAMPCLKSFKGRRLQNVDVLLVAYVSVRRHHKHTTHLQRLPKAHGKHPTHTQRSADAMKRVVCCCGVTICRYLITEDSRMAIGELIPILYRSRRPDIMLVCFSPCLMIWLRNIPGQR